MEVFVGSFARIEWNKSVFFKLFLILSIGVSLDIRVVECTPALSHSNRAKYMAPIDDSNSLPQRYRSIFSTLSTLNDETKEDEDISKSNDSDDEERNALLQDLNHSNILSPNSYRRMGVSKRKSEQLPIRRMMTKKALSLFAHWKPTHYTSNEDNSLASDVISAVARGHSRPMGGPLRWGRR